MEWNSDLNPTDRLRRENSVVWGKEKMGFVLFNQADNLLLAQNETDLFSQ